MSSDYSGDALVEQPTIALFAELGYKTANCWGGPERAVRAAIHD